ncbi:MAG: NAD(P)/FAD-dependent oxidoreductase, partial [Bacteroidota bacterium]
MARERRLYDAIVVGAGPGGATAAACMARYGLRVLLLDRAAFPRDKICGDAISGKSVDVLRRLGLLDRLNVAEQLVCGGVTFGGPGGEEVSIPFSRDPHQTEPTGYICARQVFDRILFQCAVDSGADVRERAEVTDLIFDERRVVGIEMRSGGATESVRAPIIVGADGAYS